MLSSTQNNVGTHQLKAIFHQVIGRPGRRAVDSSILRYPFLQDLMDALVR